MVEESAFCFNTSCGPDELLTVHNVSDIDVSWEKLHGGSTNKYVVTIEEAMKLITEYELKTTSKFSCFKADKTFGQGGEDL